MITSEKLLQLILLLFTLAILTAILAFGNGNAPLSGLFMGLAVLLVVMVIGSFIRTGLKD